MKIIAPLAVILLLAISCSNNDSSESITCDSVDISFSEDVLPIITATCATNSSCHATGSKEGPGALTSYAQVFSARTDIATAVSNGTMPKDGSLTSEQRNNIVCWIRNGASEN